MTHSHSSDRRKRFRDEDRSYGADYGRINGDEWSASYSMYDQYVSGPEYPGYEGAGFYARRPGQIEFYPHRRRRDVDEGHFDVW